MGEPDPVRVQDEPANSRDSNERISAVVTDPLPGDVVAGNVSGQPIAGPDDGFGKLWRKRFRVTLPGDSVGPAELVHTWQQRFGEFWPEGSRFYRPLLGLEPGQVVLTDLALPAGARLGTGVVVTAADERSFTFSTAQGHMLAGTITFSGYREAGETVAQVESVMRASDPLYELGMPLGGHRYENRFWKATLTALARYYGIDAQPTLEMECLDRHRKWRNASNIVHNAFIHTAISLVTRPFRRLTGRAESRSSQS